MKRIAVLALLAASIPGLALADVVFKNKDKKAVDLTIKRAGSSQNTSVPGGQTMGIPGSPLKVTVNPPAKSKDKPQSVDAVDGDQLIWEKGKLTKISETPEETPAPSDDGKSDEGKAGEGTDSGDKK